MSNKQVENAYDMGYERGKGQASWVTDGNTDMATYQRIWDGYNDGDSDVMDLQPSPLSGEWAGQSIPELSAEYGIDLEDEEVADGFADGFCAGFWDELMGMVAYQLQGQDGVPT